jgi:hypothetical protein
MPKSHPLFLVLFLSILFHVIHATTEASLSVDEDSVECKAQEPFKEKKGCPPHFYLLQKKRLAKLSIPSELASPDEDAKNVHKIPASPSIPDSYTPSPLPFKLDPLERAHYQSMKRRRSKTPPELLPVGYPVEKGLRHAKNLSTLEISYKGEKRTSFPIEISVDEIDELYRSAL